jgi:hypothetical protein
MSKTLLNQGAFYLTDEEWNRLDRLRGLIPRSRIGALALQRLLDDVENGRIDLSPEGIMEKKRK